MPASQYKAKPPFLQGWRLPARKYWLISPIERNIRTMSTEIARAWRMAKEPAA
jgi:hypothetical protein